jgi:hypothetical protein
MALLKVRPKPLPSGFSSNGGKGKGNGRIWGTSHDGKRQQRALLASATQLMGNQGVNRPEAARLNKLRQPWQEDAWTYRDAIGELRYATTYLGNACRKIVLVPSTYIPGELDPLPLTEVTDCPANIISAADDALKRLSSGGPLALGGLQRDVAENFEVAGECFLVGWPPMTQLPEQANTEEVWEIRSVSEVTATSDGTLQLRIEGSQPQAIPDGVFLQRLWYPHPRRKALADSPFAAMLDICEELLILSRDIRASGRSRLANSGLLMLPDKLTVVKANVQEDANDQETDEFMAELIQAGMAAIQDEGSASAIFPIVVRGPADALQAVRQVMISRPEAQRSQDRQELIGRMATTLDLPAEVLTGKGDLNHWTAWSIDDDTFSDHVEPLVMVMDDALTAGYLRLALQNTPGLDPDWVSKVIVWHDPTRLVRHPDRSQDALQAYDRFALSDAALRDTMGFSDTDAPSETEILARVVLKQSRLDPTIVAQIIKRMDNTIDISQVKPEPQGQAPPGDEGSLPGGGLAGPSATQPVEGPPQGSQPRQQAPTNQPPGLAAGLALVAADPKAPSQAALRKGNRSLARIEKELYDKLLTATNASMTRALEKAGARIRTTVGRTAAGRAWCASHSNFKLGFLISNAMIAAAGLDEQMLLNNAWEQLRAEYDAYLEYADKSTIESISSMLNMQPEQFSELAGQLSRYNDNGWEFLQHQLQRTAMSYLSDASNVLDVGEDAEITTTRLVSPSIVKQAIARAGGALLHSSDAGSFNPTVAVQIPPAGVTTGPAVSSALQDNGLGINSYTWVHGFTPNPFPPHEALDGVEFNSWTDDVLANEDEFPDREFFAPGDHDGCSCDFTANWSGGAEVASALVAYAEGQPRQEGGKFGGDGGEDKSASKPASETVGDRRTAVYDAKDNAGMAVQTASKLYDEGKLDDAVALAQTQQSDETISSAQDTADQKYESYGATITEEDKAAAQARHDASSRAGGDDRPGSKTRVRLQNQLVAEYGDGKHAPCIYCGRTLEPATSTLERLVPGKEGGKYVMPNLAPACYDCNNWRGNADYHETMASAKEWLGAGGHGFPVAAAAVPPQDPKFPLGTWVTANVIGYHDDPDNTEVTPIDVPLETVSGKLDGYWVGTFGYFKYIVAGYDVDEDSIVPTPEVENQTASGDQE